MRVIAAFPDVQEYVDRVLPYEDLGVSPLVPLTDKTLL